MSSVMCAPPVAAILLAVMICSCDGSDSGVNNAPAALPPPIQVLDGDTFIIGSDVLRLAGIDAPELAPSAGCWAEAALATRARVVAEQELNAAGVEWQVVEPIGRNEDGHLVASLRNAEGDDFGAILVVRGVAAAQDDWDWCGPQREYEAQGQPSIWSGPRLDTRAFD